VTIPFACVAFIQSLTWKVTATTHERYGVIPYPKAAAPDNPTPVQPNGGVWP